MLDSLILLFLACLLCAVFTAADNTNRRGNSTPCDRIDNDTPLRRLERRNRCEKDL